MDWAVGERVELVGIIIVLPVAEAVGNDAHVIHAGVLDGDRQGGIGERADLQFIVGDRGDHRRRAAIAHGVEDVCLAVVPGEIFLFQPDRGPVGNRRSPGDAHLQRLRHCEAATKRGQGESHQSDFSAHGLL